MTIQILHITHPTSPNPLNPLSQSLRTHFLQRFLSLSQDSSTHAIIVTGHSAHFSVGADIREFQSSTPIGNNGPTLIDVVNALSESRIPVIAAIQGLALGGGLELALGCDIRVMDRTAKVGLPEVKIGLIPGAQGTQRLPRLTSIPFALDAITSGRMISSREALKTGLVDAVPNPDETLKDCAMRWAEWAAALGSNAHWKLQRRAVPTCCPSSVIDDYRRKCPAEERGGEAVLSAIDAIEASLRDFDDGCRVEEELFAKLLLESRQGAAKRHLFFAERKASSSSFHVKEEGVLKDGIRVALSPHQSTVGIIGAGTMGCGIALSFLLARYRQVVLIDVRIDNLQRGIQTLQTLLKSHVKKKKMTQGQVDAMLSPPRLLASTRLEDLKPCGLVVEAVFENRKLKRDIMTQVDDILSPLAILASNTSTLDLDRIFQCAKYPTRCAGMHFFSPAHVMPLVEIVTSSRTSEETVALLQTVTKRLNKVGVVVGNCDGFVGNRMLHPYSSEAVLLLTEGCGVEDVDRAIKEFGVKLGPLEMSDLAGNDIGYLIRKEKGVVRDPSTGLPGKNRPGRYTELGDDLVVKLKRVGQKALKGWYDYDPQNGKGRTPIPSDEVSHFIASYRTQNKHFTPQQIVERVLYPLVNEGFKILEEKIALDPCHVDVIYVYGYGWPNWRGGPMYWADHEVGLDTLLSKLEELQRLYPASEYFQPSSLLRKCVKLGVGVQEYFDKKMYDAEEDDGKVRSKL